MVVIVKAALVEDGVKDLTTSALGIRGRARGVLLAKEPGVLAGGPMFEAIVKAVDRRATIHWLVRDGAMVKKGQRVAVIKGLAPALLRAERPALNLLQRMSGIATVTKKYVDAVKGTKAVILDTRKTMPGLRELDKYAVRVGGGHNHRASLAEAILVKDNHLRFIPSVGEATRRAIRVDRRAQIEVNTFAQLREAVGAGARMVLLDNFPPALLRKALRWCHGKVITEVSGGMTVAKARQAARWGADRISVGALTHSVKVIDFSLELYPVTSQRSQTRR